MTAPKAHERAREIAKWIDKAEADWFNDVEQSGRPYPLTELEGKLAVAIEAAEREARIEELKEVNYHILHGGCGAYVMDRIDRLAALEKEKE